MQNILKKDKNSNLGAIRLICGILGSLPIAYLLMMFIAKTLSYSIFENIVLVIIILPFLWSLIGLWIILSTTKINAILKTVIPSIVLYICAYII